MREVHWGLIPDMTGTLMLSRLVRGEVMKNLVFTGRSPHAVRSAKKLINHLSNDRVRAFFALERAIIL
jgi:hypothetical protein